MTLIRSLLFNVFFIGGQMVMMAAMAAALPFPRTAIQSFVRAWTRGLRWVMRRLVGIRFEVRGRDNLPDGACLIAAKHQSAWDTFAFYLLLDDPIYVMKIELMRLPVWGAYARKAEMIGVDRAAGAAALKGMVRDAGAALDAGRQVIIFPEGTRTAPGTRRPYHPGVAAVATACDVPVIPVAINSGLFWARHSVIKRPGTIVMDILPPMPRGLSRRDFMAELESRIESATARLTGRPVDNMVDGSAGRAVKRGDG